VAIVATTVAAPSLAQDARDTLRVGMYSKAPSRGNTMAVPSGVPSMYWWEGVFDAVTRVDDKAQILPFAATSWKLIDNTTWQVTFRPDIEFSNGNKHNAANFAAQLDYLAGDGKAASLQTSYGRFFESWKAIDERTIEIKTKAPYPLLAGALARFYVVDMKAWKDMGVEAHTARPVTSGPWKVVSWTDTEANFTAHDKSWRPGKIRNLRFIELTEIVARRQALESGQVDLVTNMNPDDIKPMEAVGQVVVSNAPNIMSMALFTEDFSPDKKKWNGKPPFADKRVRQAVNYAVDRNAIAKNLLNGVFEPASQPANPQTFGYNPDVKPYPNDLNRAKALMTEAGYANGFNMIAEFIPGAIANDKEIYNLIADSMGRIGIKADLRPLPFSEWVTKLTQKKWEGEATGFSYLVDPMMDASQPFNWYSCNAPAVFVCIEEHKPLIAAAATEMDRNKREAILKDLMKRANEDALSIAVVNGRDIFGLSKRVRDFKNWNRVLYYEEMFFQG
jgi:peptide/nickel transport system substrate-binding protein